MAKFKFWTVQKKAVVDYVMEHGVYQPAVQKSDFVPQIPGIDQTYNLIVNSFNAVNGTDVPGVIFAFMVSDGEDIKEIPNFEMFQRFIVEKQFAIKSVWNNLAKPENVIVEIERELDFNPIFIDINDYNALVPPVMPLPPYSEDVLHELIDCIKNGVAIMSPFPSGVVQVHLDCIREEDIVAIYPTFVVE